MGLDQSPPEYQKLCAHIGHLAVSWAFAEEALDTIIFYVHEVLNPRKFEQQLPRSFNRKPPYLRAVFSSDPKYQAHLQAIEPLLNEAVEIAAQRNTFVHSVIQTDKNKRLVMRRRNKPLKKGTQIQRTTPAQLDDLSARCTVLALNLINFSCDPMGVVTADFINEFYRKITAENV